MPVAWLSVLMADDDDSDASLEAPIHDGIWKDSQRKYSPAVCGWRTEVRMRNQKLGNALELVQKTQCHRSTSPLGIEIQGVCNVLLGTGMKRISH